MIPSIRHIRHAVVLGMVVVAASFCAATAADKGKSEADHEHDHPEAGPHKGALIELGKEEYHAEILHDDEKHTVTIYILDSSAKKQVAIAAKEIFINVKHGKKGEQFKLASSPDKGGAKGTSSRFAVKNQELCEHLDEEGVDARLSLKIKDKSYSAKIAHEHDHDHDHDKK